VARLGFQKFYCGRQGSTAADKTYSYLLGQQWRSENKMIQNHEGKKGRSLVTALKRMVTVWR
jgi:hypothetical protein